MTKRIFRSILFVSLLSVFLVVLGISVIFYRSYTNRLMDTLKVQTEVIANMVNDTGDQYLRQLDDDAYRLNLIDAKGKVLYDSSQDPDSMPNHYDRPELEAARQNGRGTAVRYSDTLAEQTLYSASLLDNGSFIRTSVTVTSIYGYMIGLIGPFALIVVLIILLCLVLSRKLSQSIVQPILDINLDHPLDSKTYPQIQPLLERIEASNEKIASQMKELRRKSEELEAVAQNMDEGLLILSSNREVLSCNGAARRIFQMKDGWKVMDLEPLQKALNKASQFGRGVFEMESNGRWYVIEAASIHTPPKPKGFVVVALDITEKNDAAKRRREFTANVTHELKTPVQTIMSSAELLENGLVKPEDTGRFYSYISKESQRLLDLINDIIRLSELEGNTQEELEKLDLKDLLQEVVRQNDMGLKNRSLRLHEDLQAVQTYGNRRMWKEVFSNLLENAIKYNRFDGSIDLTLKEQQKMILFQISDTGIGIEPKYQDRVFERFFRVDKSHSKATGGTGLGLAIVNHSVQKMKGTIALSSKPDQGTTIEILVPVHHLEGSDI